ncbi:MAG: leucyl/phenylalanyl-tRNA--protein transferase [Alphaproteobacteria bacterium]|nr:MAG: leucyl/phenylalanyl-tRNA--protein transferase [Alphaproteobacteria bacterium]TAF74979.1 MAG: leucyl/phenylalanyl-tRNA--protein transferase [Alphaproteobacteria bacterium]
MVSIHPETLILAYESGYFPMAEHRHAKELHWFSPDPRAIIPLDAVHIPKSLRKYARKHPYRITINHCFTDVMRCCATPRTHDGDSWINEEIIALYSILHQWGDAHSVECWDATGSLVGGLYGVSRGGAFFGESMFCRAPNASKIAFLALIEIMHECGYALLDSQFINDHMRQFGTIEIPRKDYMRRLKDALIVSPNPSRLFIQYQASDCSLKNIML